MAERGGSRTLARGLAVLQALGRGDDGATVADLATMTGLDRAVLYRLLTTLTAAGFVFRDEASRRFHLGVALVELGARAGRSLEVTRVSLRGMRALMEATGEAVCLAVPDHSEAVVVQRIEPPGLFVRIGYSVGFRHDLGVGAHGQALLAAMAASDGVRSLSPRVRNRIRTSGFAVSADELETGASGVAAAVLDLDARPVAAVGVVAPTARLPHPDVIGPRVASAARDISRRLGYRRG